MEVVTPDYILKGLDARVAKSYNKQVRMIQSQGVQHSSLKFESIIGTERMKDPHRQYSFRINKKWRAFCFKIREDTLEVFAITAHDYKHR